MAYKVRVYNLPTGTDSTELQICLSLALQKQDAIFGITMPSSSCQYAVVELVKLKGKQL